MIVLPNPTQAYLIGYEDKLTSLEKELSYRNLSVYYQYKNHIDKKQWFTYKYGEKAYDKQLSSLKGKIDNSLLFKDKNGIWTYSGLVNRIATKYDDYDIKYEYEFPEFGIIPWYVQNRKTPRIYQQQAHDTLIKSRHGAIELATGGGKTLIIVNLCKTIALQTTIVVPSKSIADQMYKDLCYNFGKKNVGLYGDGKKQIGKRFTVAIAQSLIRLEKDTEEYDFFSNTKTLILDESHIVAADTLSKLCFNLFKYSPYRFFVSGTQLRNDVKELVNEGYLSKPIFIMLNIEEEPQKVSFSKDTNKITRSNLYYNEKISRTAADWANKLVEKGKTVLILIEEIDQFCYIYPYLKGKFDFAHGGLTNDNNKNVPKEYHKSEPNELVEKLNNKEIDILVGTSCVAIGTDFTSVGAVVYLRGGKSPIEVRQSVGRGTRMVEGKKDFFFIDFNVKNVLPLTKHAEARAEIYKSIYGPVNYIEV